MGRPVQLAGLVVVAALLGCEAEGAPPLPAASAPAPTSVRPGPITPLPAQLPVDPGKAALGERLFHERRLSADGSVSCATCHPLERGGADGLRRSVGIRGQVGAVNAPTVLNAAFNFVQFWDGRAQTLAEQARGPVAHPQEMGARWPEVVARLGADATYRRAFDALYEDGVTEDNVVDAIAAYERTLITPGGAFDRWLEGDDDAITDDAREGYAAFQQLGCAACHQGRGVGGNMFQRVGVVGSFFKDRALTDADLGRFNVTGRPDDKHVFKVPSLRNVAQTAPYFHDGSAATLEEAIDVMARVQLGRTVTPAQRQQLVAFLRSLSGPLPTSGATRAR